MATITYTGNGVTPLTFDSDITSGDPAYGWDRFAEAPRRERLRRYHYPGADGEAVMRLGGEAPRGLEVVASTPQCVHEQGRTGRHEDRGGAPFSVSSIDPACARN